MKSINLKSEQKITNDISPELLGRYIETRRRIDHEASAIQSITAMLALLETCGDDTITVDPVALGNIHQMMNDNILNIREILDDFIYIVAARLELEAMDSEG